MAKEQSDLSPERAKAFREKKHAEAAALGLKLDDYFLVASRENDIDPNGSGPRYAFVKLAQKMARNGATYGQVIDLSVKKGNGELQKFAEADLLGYVCANDYCRLVQPGAKTDVANENTPAKPD
jgi:hypothetical protein